MSDIRSFIVELYDQTVEELESDQGALSSDVRDAMFEAVKERLESEPRDIEAEAQSLIFSTITQERDRRRKNLKRDAERILEVLQSGALDIPVDIEPLLKLSYPTGDARGVDMTLRRWRLDDIPTAITARYRNAAAVTVQAKEFDDVMTSLADEVSRRGHYTIGGPFEGWLSR